MSEGQVRAIFMLAGIDVKRLWKLVNEYWTPEAEIQHTSPWWLVKTGCGLIRIGWRKRVIEIDWSETDIECKATDDPVTQEAFLVHAWTTEKAVEYLREIWKHNPWNGPVSKLEGK